MRDDRDFSAFAGPRPGNDNGELVDRWAADFESRLERDRRAHAAQHMPLRVRFVLVLLGLVGLGLFVLPAARSLGWF